MLHYNITFSLRWLLLLFLIVTPAYGNNNAKPLIVTTTKPLAIIAKSALQDRAVVNYIMPSAQSPHNAVMTISDVKKVAAADLVLWVGPNFEARAAKQLQSIPKTKLVTAIEWLDLDHRQPLLDKHHHGDYAVDPHIWLSPTTANRIAEVLQKRLGLPPREIFNRRQRAAVNAILAPVKELSYLSHHDGLGYFVNEFKLKPALAIRDSMGEKRGARTQYDLRVRGRQLGVHCVFVEPQHGNKDALAIAQDLSLPLKYLDLQASDQQMDEITYEKYIRGIAEQFKACFE